VIEHLASIRPESSNPSTTRKKKFNHLFKDLPPNSHILKYSGLELPDTNFGSAEFTPFTGTGNTMLSALYRFQGFYNAQLSLK
jgi:hypothetical protein